MKATDISHHAQTVIELGEGIIDLHSTGWDFPSNYARFLHELLEQVGAEIARINPLHERARQQEARAEPEYRY